MKYQKLRERIVNWIDVPDVATTDAFIDDGDDGDEFKIGQPTGTINLCYFAWVEGMMCFDKSITGMPYMVLQMIIKLINLKWNFNRYVGAAGATFDTSSFNLIPLKIHKTVILNMQAIINDPFFTNSSIANKFKILLRVCVAFQDNKNVNLKGTVVPDFAKKKFDESGMKTPDTMIFIDMFYFILQYFHYVDLNNITSPPKDFFIRKFKDNFSLAKIRAELLHVAVSTAKNSPYNVHLRDKQSYVNRVSLIWWLNELFIIAGITEQGEIDRCKVGLSQNNFSDVLAYVRREFTYAGSKIETDVFEHWSDERKQQVHQIIKNQKMRLIVL